MSGPPRTPTAIRKARGNPGKRAYNAKEPTLAPGAPAMPPSLKGESAKEWKRLVDMAGEAKVLTRAERSIIELASRAYAMWAAAEQALADAGGLTYETTNTTGGQVIKARPEVSIASDAWRRYRAAICELGFTPAARARVSVTDEQAPEDPADKYLQ